jgi:hypothetical protein
VRRAILGIVVAIVGVACSNPGADHLPQPASILMEPSASPFTGVTAGDVHALVPDGWHALLADPDDDVRGGFVASPKPTAWRHMDGSITGMAATWVDATRVGVPSDFYYLAAHGPLLSGLTRSTHCRADSTEVLLDNRPAFAHGIKDSPGDYMARGEGTCHLDGRPTRWAYFVAAPGFGPVRRIGIPSSGLYVVVAIMPDSSRAASLLRRLIANTTFAGTSVPQFMAAARAT